MARIPIQTHAKQRYFSLILSYKLNWTSINEKIKYDLKDRMLGIFYSHVLDMERQCDIS